MVYKTQLLIILLRGKMLLDLVVFVTGCSSPQLRDTVEEKAMELCRKVAVDAVMMELKKVKWPNYYHCREKKRKHFFVL